MQSAFSMTEPMNPGSDPRSLTTRAELDGDEWVINGHKWFTSNGLAADFLIVMCRTDDGLLYTGSEPITKIRLGIHKLVIIRCWALSEPYLE